MTNAPTDLAPRPSQVAVRPAKWKRGTLAAVLSFLFAGMGQLYNRQPLKAFAFALISAIPGVLMVSSRVLFSFWAMLATLSLSLLWKVFITADAAWGAARLKKAEALSPQGGIAYAFLACTFFVAGFFPTIQQVKSQSGVAAFKVPSASMCPTICAGERIIADMHAYSSRLPQRGDLVLVKIPAYNTLFVKRVIGVPGDVVAPGPAGPITVNGRQIRFPAPWLSLPGKTRIRLTPRLSSRQPFRKDRILSSEIICPIASIADIPSSAM